MFRKTNFQSVMLFFHTSIKNLWKHLLISQKKRDSNGNRNLHPTWKYCLNWRLMRSDRFRALLFLWNIGLFLFNFSLKLQFQSALCWSLHYITSKSPFKTSLLRNKTIITHHTVSVVAKSAVQVGQVAVLIPPGTLVSQSTVPKCNVIVRVHRGERSPLMISYGITCTECVKCDHIILFIPKRKTEITPTSISFVVANGEFKLLFGRCYFEVVVDCVDPLRSQANVETRLVLSRCVGQIVNLFQAWSMKDNSD